MCLCSKKPACEEHAHRTFEGAQVCDHHGHIVFGALPNHDGPPCIWCNGPTRRTGLCFTCAACGATTSC